MSRMKRSGWTVRMVRVRFAPSPTGNLHLGSLRTALYNFLFAKHHKGCFILRIEDTDRARLVPGSVSSRLALLRKDAVRRNEVPKYDKKCRSIAGDESRSRADAGEPFVVRLKLDKQNVSFVDEVFGSVDQCIDESDMVLLKSDGFPTYHLANIVDDRAMHISHVIRGMEWLSSTGKHVLLYK
ncbi:tRNA ligase class I, catalytic domain protein [Teladorsagia circumcincta]|uniref:tRNA ligase class I, catalytic domain protein n=1 Tax=Teladorsagia circumcincta TaxID=45464 RepID=A0A2G9UUL2_TELCI|nr:tRNA ligase class I, catalytic domain protein [Teladorsagia circumcincta]